MKREYVIEGMMCDHCRTHVQNALNGIEGVRATVTLDPPVATIEFDGMEIEPQELQRIIEQRAGNYKLSSRKS